VKHLCIAVAAFSAAMPIRAFALLPLEDGAPAELSFEASRIVLIEREAPGTSTSGDSAEAHARAYLTEHIAELAPGCASSDFVLAADDFDAGIRTIAFYQQHDGIRVHGGELSLLYSHDRLVLLISRALPFDDPSLDPGPPPDASNRDVVLLPLRMAGQRSYRWANRLLSRIPGPPLRAPSERDVFVDPMTGEMLGASERLRFSTGTLALHVPLRSPSYGPRIEAPAVMADLTVDGTSLLSSATGTFPFTSATAHVSAWSSGPNVNVLWAGMPGAGTTFDISDGGTYSWDASADELTDAQLSAFVHADEVRVYAKTFAPTLAFLDDQVHATVNADGVCNSYSDGTFIHFFKSGGGCENTGRIADVVYHEYGHSIHTHAIIPGAGVFEGALSEGVADYLATTITGDPAMGRGIRFDSTPVRDLDPSDYENRWPDDLVGEIHHDGLIIGQALWDLRKELIQKLGTDAGRARADFLYYQGIRRAADIPSMYSTVLVADDDDGNISNGTPNICEINSAFGLHGLRGVKVSHVPPSLETEATDGYPLEAHVDGLFPGCPDDAIASATVSYRTEGTDAQEQTLPMSIDGTTLRATLPKASPRSTLDYRIDVTLAGGRVLSMPDNAADPWYQVRVGPVSPIYCTDFERDPSTAGWTHGASSTNADDWEWGAPAATPFNADPSAPFSGLSVFGNDLGDVAGHDGKYQGNMTNWAESPIVDTTGYDQVRLEYRRWLTVEDASTDQASIYANSELAWRNGDSGSGTSPRTDHRDREWRFHDVDLTPFVQNHSVKIRFELASHGTRQLGGWTLDDFCIVGVPGALPVPNPKATVTPKGGAACSASERNRTNTGSAWMLGILGSVFFALRRSRRR
jgi:hypothetical protein